MSTISMILLKIYRPKLL